MRRAGEGHHVLPQRRLAAGPGEGRQRVRPAHPAAPDGHHRRPGGPRLPRRVASPTPSTWRTRSPSACSRTCARNGSSAPATPPCGGPKRSCCRARRRAHLESIVQPHRAHRAGDRPGLLRHVRGRLPVPPHRRLSESRTMIHEVTAARPTATRRPASGTRWPTRPASRRSWSSCRGPGRCRTPKAEKHLAMGRTLAADPRITGMTVTDNAGGHIKLSPLSLGRALVEMGANVVAHVTLPRPEPGRAHDARLGPRERGHDGHPGALRGLPGGRVRGHVAGGLRHRFGGPAGHAPGPVARPGRLLRGLRHQPLQAARERARAAAAEAGHEAACRRPVHDHPGGLGRARHRRAAALDAPQRRRRSRPSPASTSCRRPVARYFHGGKVPGASMADSAVPPGGGGRHGARQGPRPVPGDRCDAGRRGARPGLPGRLPRRAAQRRARSTGCSTLADGYAADDWQAARDRRSTSRGRARSGCTRTGMRPVPWPRTSRIADYARSHHPEGAQACAVAACRWRTRPTASTHDLVFTPGTTGFAAGTAFYERAERWKVGRPLHVLEQVAKVPHVRVPRLRRLLAAGDRLPLPRIAVRQEPAQRPLRRHRGRPVRDPGQALHLGQGLRPAQALRRGADHARPSAHGRRQRPAPPERLGQHLPRTGPRGSAACGVGRGQRRNPRVDRPGRTARRSTSSARTSTARAS